MPDADPLVSVVIPAYNSAAFLEATLSSVKNQTFADYEIIVVDDGSSDNTQAVAEAFMAKNGLRGRCIRQANKKIAAARNTGMRAAAGRFVALLDHDDLWYPRKLERVMAVFKNHPETDLVCHDVGINSEGRVSRVFKAGACGGGTYETLLFHENALTPSSSVFKKSAADAAGGFCENPDYNTVEDYDFWLRMSKTAKFYFLHETLGEYQVVPAGASKKTEYHLNNLESLLRSHFKSFGQAPSARIRRLMNRRLAIVYRSGAREFLKSGNTAKAREYVARMLKAFPFEPKNIAMALIWCCKSAAKTLEGK